MIKKSILLVTALMLSFGQSIHAQELNIGNLPQKVSGKIELNSAQARKYFLGPNDIINISVLGSPELTSSGVRVQPDGKINLPYFEGLSVTGLSTTELQEKIREKYREYVENPEVSITLSQSRPFIVYLSGAIYNPGTYELNTITNSTPFYSKPEAFIERKTPLLSNVIVAAGGITYDADLENVQIKNDIDGSSYTVNLLEIIEHSNSSEDIYLVAGDKVNIPRLPSPLAINEKKYRMLAKSTLFQRDVPVRVIGHVRSPGLFRVSSSDSISLNSVIATAGGYGSAALYPPKKVYISRIDNNNKMVTRAVNPRKDDVLIMPNDIVYVPEKVSPLIGRSFDYLFRALAPISAFSGVYNTWDVIDKR